MSDYETHYMESERALRKAEAEVERFRTALRGLMMMIENGYLVRQTNGDGDPGWELRQLPLVKALAEAEAALSGEAP